MVIALFRENHIATILICFQRRKGESGQDERLQIPYVVLQIVAVVAPMVDLQVMSDGEVIHITCKHQMVINKEFSSSDTIMIVYAVHIVVGPQGKSHLSPCFERLLQMMGREAKGLLLTASLEDALTLFRTCHESMSLGRNTIHQEVANEFQWVKQVPCTVVMDFKMQMRGI